MDDKSVQQNPAQTPICPAPVPGALMPTDPTMMMPFNPYQYPVSPMEATCPHCGKSFQMDPPPVGFQRPFFGPPFFGPPFFGPPFFGPPFFRPPFFIFPIVIPL